MTKVVLEDLANLQNENTVITSYNTNNASIEAGFDKTLSRDGTTPNQMLAQLDMNSNRIINLPSALFDSDPIRLDDLQAYVADHSFTVVEQVPVLSDFDFETRAAVATKNVGATVNFIRTAGYTAVGDGGAALYKRIGAQPTHIGKVQSLDGTWWELVIENGCLFSPQVGVFGNNVSCDLQGAIDCLTAIGNGGYLQLPAGIIKPAAAVTVTGKAVHIKGVNRSMQISGYYPITAHNTTHIIPDTSLSGYVFTFHTKLPVFLEDFSIIMPAGPAVTGNGIWVDNKDGDIPFAYVGNFGTRIQNIHIVGGQTGIRMLNAAEYDIANNFLWEVYGTGIWGENDSYLGTADGGDYRIHHNVIQAGSTEYGGSAAIRLNNQGGVQIHDNKLLGYQIGILYDCTYGGTGEVNIHSNNIEAWSVNGVRVQQSVDGTQCGGFDIVNNHFNGGGGGATKVQSCIAITNGITAEYVFRGRIIGNDILYGNSSAGATAISLAGGTNFLVADNSFQLESGNHLFTTGGFVTNVQIHNSGMQSGIASANKYNSLNATTRVVDFIGIPFAALGAWENGSTIFVTDGTHGSNPLTGGGNGALAKRINGTWVG